MGAMSISHISSDHLPRKIERKTIIEIVLHIGKAIRSAILNSPAPSILADSNISEGNVLK